MGFLKRFLSLGNSKSRKNKKKQSAAPNPTVDAEGRILTDRPVQNADTNANRLLRSSSTKFSVMSAIDYTQLPPVPPLPHSMNDLLATPPLTPSPSLVTVATTPGLSRSGTYLVKVHGRTTHSRTEFPRANPPASPTRPRRKQVPSTPEPEEHEASDDDDEADPAQLPRLKAVNFTPKDTSRLFKLRRDPSVASLLNLYDDHGCLDSNAFANSPPSPEAPIHALEGREPRPRTGSTLRQLLGEPTFAVNNTTEGDISWAERFLDEQLCDDDDSPLPSPITPQLETPKDNLFSDTPSKPRVATADATLSSLDPDSSINYPAISSMEVEVSEENMQDAPVIEVIPVSKPLFPDPKTPQRASEVFGFLSRRNTLMSKERDLPPLPQIITPESTGNSALLYSEVDLLHPRDTSLGEHTDAIHSANTSHSSTQPTSSDTHSTASHAQIQTATMTKLSSAFAASTTSLNLLMNTAEPAKRCSDSDDSIAHEATTNHTGSSKAASHTTGTSLSSSNSIKAAPSKIPRGPRPRPLSVSRPDAPFPVEQHDTESDTQPGPSRHMEKHASDPARTREVFTNIPQRQHRRATSRSSGRDVFLRGPSPLPSVAGPSSGPKEPARKAHTSRKRSTKPEYVTHAYARDKENTPSPPASLSKSASRRKPPPSESVTTGSKAMAVATPIRTRMLQAGEPPSPASSSELSPVAREMMNDLRQQRARARQVERRRGIWVRD